MNKNESILITGATGFVGLALVRRLVDEGVKNLVLLARNSLPDTYANCVSTNFEISPKSDFRSLLQDVGVVIHLAARVHVMNDKSTDALAEYRRDNLESTINLARQSAASGVKRFIFMSSVKVNGELTEKDIHFRAEDIPHPEDPYGVSKAEAECALIELAKKTDMEVVIIRPPLVYGPGVKANFLSMIKMLDIGIPLPFGNVRNKRSLVFIDNLVDLLIRVIDHPKAAGQVFLVSDDHDVSTTTLLKSMSSALGKKAKLIPIPLFLLKAIFYLIGKAGLSHRLLGSLCLDISKTKELLNWSPPVSFEEGIEKTAGSFLNK